MADGLLFLAGKRVQCNAPGGSCWVRNLVFGHLGYLEGVAVVCCCFGFSHGQSGRSCVKRVFCDANASQSKLQYSSHLLPFSNPYHRGC